MRDDAGENRGGGGGLFGLDLAVEPPRPPRLSALWTSKDGTWNTPRELFACLHREFRFTLDACAADRSVALCPDFYSADSLDREWTGSVWCNPPYGRDVGRWIEKAAAAARAGAVVVLLLPARTDTRWWHEVVMRQATDIRFLRGRLRFSGAKCGAPFPSVVVVFGRTSCN